MYDPFTQTHPGNVGQFGFGQPFTYGPQQSPYGAGFGTYPAQAPSMYGQGLQGSPGNSPFGFTPQLAPQTWLGNPFAFSQSGYYGIAQQMAAQQIPQIAWEAQRIAQHAPLLAQQIPQLIQQNPQLAQHAPQLQQIPVLLQQAAELCQRVPHVLQAVGASPYFAGASVRPIGFM